MSPYDIRLLRARLGLSQTEAAALCGVQDRTWRRWEAGDMAPADGHLAPCFDLLAQQDRAVAEALVQHAQMTREFGRAEGIDLLWSDDPDEAEACGWPSPSAWLAVLRRVADVAPCEVRVLASSAPYRDQS